MNHLATTDADYLANNVSSYIRDARGK